MDPSVLSQYVLALLKHDKPILELKSSCVSQLKDFLGQGTHRLFSNKLIMKLSGVQMRLDLSRLCSPKSTAESTRRMSLPLRHIEIQHALKLIHQPLPCLLHPPYSPPIPAMMSLRIAVTSNDAIDPRQTMTRLNYTIHTRATNLKLLQTTIMHGGGGGGLLPPQQPPSPTQRPPTDPTSTQLRAFKRTWKSVRQ